MTIKEIHDEYYAQFRGQGTSLPVYGDQEFSLGMILLRAAIDKWDRVDGELWRELNTSLATQKTLDPTIINTVSGTSMAAPSNMRKPPAEITFTLTNGSTATYAVNNPQDASVSGIWFVGGANTGYTMRIGSDLIATLTGATYDYRYIKKPFKPTVGVDSSTQSIDMSDPQFAVQYMLALRFQQARNGFGFKAAMQEAMNALANMRLENSSGTWGGAETMKTDGVWGVYVNTNDIRL